MLGRASPTVTSLKPKPRFEELNPLLEVPPKGRNGWWMSWDDALLQPELVGETSNIFWNFHPENWGRFSPILTIIFFKGVGEKPPTRERQGWDFYM